METYTHYNGVTLEPKNLNKLAGSFYILDQHWKRIKDGKNAMGETSYKLCVCLLKNVSKVLHPNQKYKCKKWQR